MRVWAVTVAAVLGIAASEAMAAKLDAAAVNDAQFQAKAGKGPSPSVVKAQVLLDRARFSPGTIDGRAGENFRKAVAAFAEAQGLKAKKLDREVWDRLAATSGDPILLEYVITDEDLKGPFVEKIPNTMEEMAPLARLAYTGPTEALAEKFHMDEALLKALNPGKALDKAGETILVPNVVRERPKAKAAKIEVDKSERRLRAFDRDGKLLLAYPASVGSRAKPAPSGSFKVTAIAENPSYTYNPKYKFKSVKSDKPFTVKPGPNNPVGAVWIDLSLDSYGIHGTPEPSKVGKSYSHGCVRLTNWDAKELAQMVERGTPVEFVD